MPPFPSRDAQDAHILLCAPQNALWAVCLHGGVPGGPVAKNPPAVLASQVPSLGREDPLQEDMATHSSVLAWRVPMDRGAGWDTVPGVAKGQPGLSTGKSRRDTSINDPAKMSLSTPGLCIQRLTATFSAAPEKLYFRSISLTTLGSGVAFKDHASFFPAAALPAGRGVVLSGNHDCPPEPSPLKNMGRWFLGSPVISKTVVGDGRGGLALQSMGSQSWTRLSD